MVPRPLGNQLVAERPGEVLMMDFIKMGASRSGFMYVLMLGQVLATGALRAGRDRYRYPLCPQPDGLVRAERSTRLAYK